LCNTFLHASTPLSTISCSFVHNRVFLHLDASLPLLDF